MSEESSDNIIDKMLDNMDKSNETDSPYVSCPITGCQYSNTVRSVSGHVSGSTQTDHSWSNTKYNGWRHFIQSHSGSSTITSSEDREDVVMSADEIESEQVNCPCCGYKSHTAKSVANHFTHEDEDHDWSDTEYAGKIEFIDKNRTIHDKEFY